jgi:steroid delta-isomerase-like uncharacterized protein
MSNKKIAERLLIEIWNQGKLDAADELIAAEAVNHDPGNPFADEKGPAAYKKLVGMYLEAFPNTTFTVRDQIEEGDKVVTRWTAKGTHKGALMGVPATGKDVEINGISIDRFENGKVVEAWSNWDSLGMLQQLGVVPKMG